MKDTHILIGLALLALGIYIGSVIAKAQSQIAVLIVQNQNTGVRLAAIEKAQAEHDERWRFLNNVADKGRKLLAWF